MPTIFALLRLFNLRLATKFATKAPKMAKDGLILAPRMPKTTPRWPQHGPRWLRHGHTKPRKYRYDVQHEFQDPQDNRRDLQLGAKMAPKSPQNGPRDLQLGPSRLQDAPCDLHETSQITMRTAPPHDANDLHTFTPFQPQTSDQVRNQSLQNGQRLPYLGPKKAQNSPKVAATWPKMASTWPH